MSETMNLKGLLSREKLAAEYGGTVYLLVQVTAPEQRSADRLALNLSAVLDRSGSMQGAKLAYTQKAMSFLVDQVDGRDLLSVVAYDDQVQVLQKSAHIGNKDLLKREINGLRAGGMTNLSGGLTTGVREVRKNAGKGRVNRVLLMTDGLANQGITTRDGLVAKARRVRQSGILLTTLGVGDGFDEDLLTAMAGAGGGNFYYVEDPDRIPAIFSQELQGLLAVAGQSLGLAVRAGAGVRITGVLGYPPTGTGEEIRMELPDIYAGETKSLVLELQVSPGAAGLPERRRLAEVELTYDDTLGGRGDVTVSLEIPIDLEPAGSLPETPDNPDVLREVYLVRSAEAIDEAIDLADRRDFARSSEVLEDIVSYLTPLADDPGVARQVGVLREKVEELKSSQYEASTRKHLRTFSHQNRTGRRQE